MLYGLRAFTGRLPATWPRSEAQLPINVGDRAYDPQYPYGWGLTTPTKVPESGTATRKALRLADAAGRAGSDAAGRALVTRARPTVRQKAGGSLTARVAKPFAEADRLLLTGRYAAASEKPAEAYRAA